MKYDHGDRLSELTDAKGNTSTRTYDAVGRLLGNRRPGHTTLTATTVGNVVANYDAEGRRISRSPTTSSTSPPPARTPGGM
ncbi:MAG: hypothetical protein R2724_22625 [Bryobacterales bacterium]